jgi:hypothetical protein
VFFESSTKSHAISQREAEAEAAAKMRLDREAAMKRAGIPIPEPGAPTHYLEKGEILIGDRVYQPSDGGFFFPCDPIPLMAACDPAPGSEAAVVASRGVRNPPKLVSLRPLSPHEQTRLDERRHSQHELSEEQRRDQRQADARTKAFCLEQLAKLEKKGI